MQTASSFTQPSTNTQCHTVCASLVAVDDCGEPVGDEDGGASARGRVEGAHDAALRYRVQRGRRLVEH